MTEVEHVFPDENTMYIHEATDDLVRFVHRYGNTYEFSINGGERTLRLDVEDWPAYREFLVDGGRA